MKRAVLTGATGAIGTALIQELIKQNIEVLVLCREGSARNQRIPKHPLVTTAYCSLEELTSFQNPTDKLYDVFYHFAWAGTAGEGRNQMKLQNQNVAYALDAVELAMRLGCKRFIGAGSQAEYGRVEGVLTPDTPAFPENGYGIAKLCAGQMTRELSHQLGMEHVWVRVLSVYGPGDGAQSMVMSTIEKLKKGEIPQFTKGEQIWDYLYSGDAAKAFYLLGEKGTDGKVYVLGSGQGKPLADYIKEIRNQVAPESELALGVLPYGEKQVMYLVADVSQLTKDTGWTTETEFSDGIRYIIKKVKQS